MAAFGAFKSFLIKNSVPSILEKTLLKIKLIQ